MEQIDILDKFERKYCVFNKGYAYDFDNFWRRKISIEKSNAHILDNTHFNETYEKIYAILSGWDFARPRNLKSNIWYNLKESLWKISPDYNLLRKYSLLDLEDIDMELLQKIWNQLSLVKQENNLQTDTPLIVSIGKPLMLIWGQTTGLDSRVRGNLYNDYFLPFMNRRRWTFEEWHQSMSINSKLLKENQQLIDNVEIKSMEKYQVDQPIPYGRFLDIYYF